MKKKFELLAHFGHFVQGGPKFLTWQFAGTYPKSAQLLFETELYESFWTALLTGILPWSAKLLLEQSSTSHLVTVGKTRRPLKTKIHTLEFWEIKSWQLPKKDFTH